MKDTRVTVLLPVYNSESYLAESIESILNQTYPNFELYIVDDGSGDNSVNIIKDYALKDNRISLYKQENLGLIGTLNKHLPLISTEYIMRMDSDDICDCSRIEKQVNYLDQNPDIMVLGTNIRYMNENLTDLLYTTSFPKKHLHILWRMLYQTGIGHATVMFRKELLRLVSGYNKDAIHVEDYEFFHRVGKQAKMANLNEALYTYRKHDSSVSNRFDDVQKKNHFHYSKLFVGEYIHNATDDDLTFFKYSLIREQTDLERIFFFMANLFFSFVKVHNLDKSMTKTIRNEILFKMRILIRASVKKNILLTIRLIFITLQFRLKAK
ncbi:MAG: glycosyltransferase [Bacteroidota bacterium]